MLGVLCLAAPSFAVPLLTEDFSSATIYNNLTVNLLNNPSITSDDNLNMWIDFPDSLRWGINTTEGYAQHLPQTSDNTNMLFYAFDASGLAAGTMIAGSFDYITTNRDGRFVLAGMLDGVNSLDPYAPWFPPDDVNDGTVLADITLSQTSGWTSVPFSLTLAQQYDVLAIGFIMGGTSGTRGVDNIDINSVPEPATLLLLGAGLLGIGGLRKKIGLL